MPNCPQCGIELTEGAAFCHQCGATVVADENPAQQATGTAENARLLAAAQPTPSERIRAASDRSPQNGDQEVELWEGDFSAKAMTETWVIIGLLTVAAIVAGILFNFGNRALGGVSAWWITAGAIVALWLGTLLVLWYRQYSVHYKLTNQRFIHERGLLSRVTDRIEVIDMDDISFSQGIVERMLGVGTIKITSSDQTHPQIVLPGIDDVREVSTLMDDARRKERRRRGLHIEAV